MCVCVCVCVVFSAKIGKKRCFCLISPNWCVKFMKTNSFRRVSDKLPKTLQKLCVSAKFPHQKIR